jgi:uroporphyrinogen III methyltransferase/synthase
MNEGKVYLLGAGPGDPGLLTVRAREVLETADVVVYDYLANEDFLGYCPEEAELVYAGKRGGDHTLSQEEINRVLVDRAGRGLTVARLKGGDPYVFGRGAEEAEQVVEAGAAFEVVPGITSAVAAPAYAGIPLTHRGFSSSVSFVTGHESADKGESALDWQALARSASTLVFFMGVRNLASIADNLMQAGLKGDTPAALVRWGTTCRQRTLVGSLDNIARKSEEAGFAAPALLVVGGVVRLKERLDWFEKRPLLGRGVVVTRAREQASGLVRTLGDMGACCLQFPTIRISPLEDYEAVDRAVRGLSRYDGVVFTSVNGVKHFFDRLRRQGLDSRAFGGCRLAAIGPATADELRGHGLEPDFVPRRYVAEEVVQGIINHGEFGERILIPRAETAREVLPQELERAGFEVNVLPVYRTELAHNDTQELLEAMSRGEVHYVSFTSSSTVHNFFQLVEPQQLRPFTEKGLRLACIGPVTEETLGEYGFTCQVRPQRYTVPELARAIARDAAGDTERSGE